MRCETTRSALDRVRVARDGKVLPVDPIPWQRDAKRGALAEPALGAQRAAMPLHDRPADRETEPLTIPVRLQPLARLEDPLGILEREAAAVVFDGDLDAARDNRLGGRLGNDRDLALYAVAAGFGRVLQQ